jgi:hypothetical protein
MSEQIYELWRSDETSGLSPLRLLERSFEIFWSFRFFHREMYHMRRKDPVLAKKWRSHMAKTMRLLQARYLLWVKNGVMQKIATTDEMQTISDLVLITASASLQFYESPDKPASRKAMRAGVRHLARFLMPYHTETSRIEVEAYLA